MKNEIVIQIAATQNEVYGLTETGKICRLDTNINKLVLRCSEEILTADRASTLTVFTPHVTPAGKYGNRAEVKTEEKNVYWWENKEAMILAVGVISIAILLTWILSR